MNPILARPAAATPDEFERLVAPHLGGVFGVALSVAVFAGAGGYASPAAFSDGFSAAMGVSAVLSLLASLTGAALPRRPRHVRAAPALEVKS